MRPVPINMMLSAMAMLAAVGALAGCEDPIEQYNPSQFQGGAGSYPTPADEPPMNLTRATRVDIQLVVDEHLEPDDHVILVNRSDGAVYDVKVTINHDYDFTVKLLEMGDTVRVPESWFKTADGRPFPSERRVRIELCTVYHDGHLVAAWQYPRNAAEKP